MTTTTKDKPKAKKKSRWGANGERYTAKDAAILRRIHKENGWVNGAKVSRK